MAHTPTYNLNHTRVRYQLGDGLNSAASGWIAAEDADNFDVDWGVVFSIRFAISETGGNGSNNAGLKAQVNKNTTGWNDVQPYNAAASTSLGPVITMPSPDWSDGDAITTRLLSGSGTFENGVGDNDNSFATNISSTESEIEVAFLFLNFYDGGNQNSDGDSFEFRLVESDGTVFSGTDNTVTITLNTTNNYIGACYPETVGRDIAVDGNGNLYMLVDITEPKPEIGILKSTDDGLTWALKDHANRPTEIDCEAMDMVLANDRLYIVYQEQGDDIHHYTFRVSTHSTNPDTWETKEEPTPFISKNANPQTCAIERFDNGDLVIFYMKDNGTVDQGYYKVKPSSGSWGSENALDTEASHWFKGVTCAKDTNNLVHVFYKLIEDGVAGEIYHRSLSQSGTLSGREVVDSNTGTDILNEAHWFPMAVPPVVWQDGSNHNVMVAYHRSTDNKLYSSIVTNDGSPGTPVVASDNTVRTSPGGTDSGQPVAALSIDGDNNIYLHYADLSTGDLFRAEYSSGSWGTDVEEIDAANIYFIRSLVYDKGGGVNVVGYTYEDDPVAGGGLTGWIFYGEYVIPDAGQTITPSGIASAEAIGSLQQLTQDLVGITGLSSSEAFGGPTMSLALVPTSIAGGEGLGSSQLNFSLATTGVASGEVFGVTEVLGPQTVSPSGISSLEAFGTALLNQMILGAGIASSETLGAHQVNLVLDTTGISSGEAFGTSQINFILLLTGLSSGEAFGNIQQLDRTLPGLTGISSEEAVGSQSVVLNIFPGAIASAELLGSPQLDLTLILTGIGSAEATGSHTVSVGGAQNIGPSAIASLEAFGVAVLNQLIVGSGIGSAEAFGSHALSLTVFPSGAGSMEAFGSHTLVMFISPAGISSSEGIGSSSLVLVVSPSGLASGEALGSSRVNFTVFPLSIGSSEAIGSHGVVISGIISPLGIGSSEALGSHTVSPGPVSVLPSGIASAEAVGNASASFILFPAGLSSSEAFGSAQILTVVSVFPSGIVSSEGFGSALLDLSISPSGVVSSEAFGSALLGLRLSPSGIVSSEALGLPSVITPQTLVLTGIPSLEAFGSANVAGVILRLMILNFFSRSAGMEFSNREISSDFLERTTGMEFSNREISSGFLRRTMEVV